MNTQKIKLALSILSGRRLLLLDDDELTMLGYDTSKFYYYGKPDKNEIRVRAEEILFNYFCEIEGNIISLHEGLANTQGVDYDY